MTPPAIATASQRRSRQREKDWTPTPADFSFLTVFRDPRMSKPEHHRALNAAVKAAWAAGRLLRQNLRQPKRINSASQHDIKLELDVRCQRLIEQRLLAAFPVASFLGEEGGSGDATRPFRWVVDPIDGTVNFTYGIPHACVSIALQERESPLPAEAVPSRQPAAAASAEPFRTVAGVVYDPFCDETWTAVHGQQARLNGRTIRVSQRHRLAEAIVALGFGKRSAAVNHLIPAFAQLVPRVRKLRLMGSAALALTYVATGRFDAFLEAGLRLWDVAAGGLIVECAGGQFLQRPLPGEHVCTILAHNGSLARPLRRWAPTPPTPA